MLGKPVYEIDPKRQALVTRCSGGVLAPRILDCCHKFRKIGLQGMLVGVRRLCFVFRDSERLDSLVTLRVPDPEDRERGKLLAPLVAKCDVIRHRVSRYR